jgi:hypothetical protein
MLLFASKMRAISLIAAAAMTMSAAAWAAPRVGITSQTDGDPLGKPPTQNERVLRVGIDIQANELITTNSDDRAHIVFLDGTALTVAPNARLMIDRFVYDPNSKTGDLSVTVSTGVLRLVGGRISKQGRITVNTPAATMGIRGGIGLFVVSAEETRAHFLFGISLAVTAGGRTETATRPGSLIVTRLGSLPGSPIMLASGALAEALHALEGKANANADTSADEAAKKSGFSALNSDRGIDGQGIPGGRYGDGQQALSDSSGQRILAGAQTSTSSSFFANPTATPGSQFGTPPGVGSVGGGGMGGSAGGGDGPSGGGRFGPPFPATPAVGVGNGGLVPAIPGGPRR